MAKPFYLTTTLPYVNADPHIGFAFELVSADIIARWKLSQGYDVFFNTGTDEHGVKVYRRAVEEGKEPQSYADEYAEKYRTLVTALGISAGVNFIRTTSEVHKKAAQEFWRQCKQSGFIYKKPYKVKYCVGCELEKTDSELENGRCPIHPAEPLEILEEENWFFKLSDPRAAAHLRALYARTDFVIPDFRLNELRALMREKGLEDFSISRLKSKMPWGVPVPDDESQVMYVWMDALVNYISAIGWPTDMDTFHKWWPVVQLAGKDQVRQQAAMWQAMLFAAGLPPSKQIVIHGFIQSGGQKMSKSLGNVIDPFALVQEYGTDAVRFYLARHIHPFEDSDFTLEKFKEAYNADLANGIGNLTSRIMKMAQDYMKDTNIPARLRMDEVQAGGRMGTNDTNSTNKKETEVLPFLKGEPDLSACGHAQAESSRGRDFSEGYKKALDSYNIHRAAEIISEKVTALDRRIQETQPFKLVKTDKVAAQKIISGLVTELSRIAQLLLPIIPVTALKIKSAVERNRIPATSLFPRR